MVLRRGTWIVVSAVALAQSADAQGRARGGGGVGGRVDVIESGGRGSMSAAYSRRPVLYGFALECVDCQPMGRGGGGGLRGNLVARADSSRAAYTLAWVYTSFP